MTGVALGLVGLWVGVSLYAYAGYPLLLWLLAATRTAYRPPREDPPEWPTVSVSLPVHNEKEVIRETLEMLLSVDYPQDRLQIVVASDASTDGTDEIVRSFADRGVELVKLPERGGKTAAENAAIPHLTGEVVVNMDASTRIPPGSFRPLIRPFSDAAVGVTSGWDRSVARGEEASLAGESGYVSYEMTVRDLESRVGGLVGASGCFYAIRRELHAREVADWLDRDFLAALDARQAGLRTVSVADAVALVPPSGSLTAEFGRKIRTMFRGLHTLLARRHLLNPFRWGLFAWMLASHKLGRWLVPLLLPGAGAGLCWLAARGSVASTALLAAGGLAGLAGLAAFRWEERTAPPAPVALCGYAAMGMAAGIMAWARLLAGRREAIWTPTRREEVSGGDRSGEAPGRDTASRR